MMVRERERGREGGIEAYTLTSTVRVAAWILLIRAGQYTSEWLPPAATSSCWLLKEKTKW